MKISRSGSLCVAALAGCALLAVSSLSPRLIAKDMVPYRGAGHGTALELNFDENGNVTAILVETGQATHFGQYRARLDCTGWIGLEGDVSVLYWTGTYVQVAADGSSVTAYATGREPLVPFPAPFTMTITITSGTGRFEGATGSWEMSAISTGDYTYTTEGTISSIGSARSGK
jgi:hypothetical protein